MAFMLKKKKKILLKTGKSTDEVTGFIEKIAPDLTVKGNRLIQLLIRYKSA